MPTLLANNTIRRIEAAALFLKLAQVAHNNIAKSAFYRSATITLYSIVEALSYELVRKHTPPPHCIGQETRYIELHKISATTLSASDDVFLCKKTKRDTLLDEGDFGKYIIFLKNKKLISHSKYLQINSIRTERNKIHLQGLKGKDVGYTKSKIERASDAITYLLSKL